MHELQIGSRLNFYKAQRKYFWENWENLNVGYIITIDNFLT